MFYKFLVLEKYYLVRIFIDFIFPGSLCEEIDILWNKVSYCEI